MNQARQIASFRRPKRNRLPVRRRSYGRVLYNWHRFYDPSVGRYISADPIGQAGGVNVYVYVGSNPLNFVDETGLCTNTVDCAIARGGDNARALLEAAGVEAGLIGLATANDRDKADAEESQCSISDPNSLEGATPEEVAKAAADGGYTEDAGPPRNDPAGQRLRKPGNPADQVRIQSGDAADPNPVKQGPYVRVSEGGQVSRPIPLAGNPTLR